MIFSFVILHYKTANDTIDCIESLLPLQYGQEDRVAIIVVDNASNNGSLEILKEKYGENDRITFLESRENLGFAGGNNMGYRYARETLHSDFIAVLNNDIVVQSRDLVPKIAGLYEQEPFHVMGPDIVSSVDGGHQNPAAATSANRKVIAKETRRYGLLLLLSRLGLYDVFRRKFGTKETARAVKEKKPERERNCQLHGSFVVFSPLYLAREQYAFFPDTFLYCEEAILAQHCKRKGYTSVYEPDLVVTHKEDSATSFVNNTSKAKREFVFRHLIKSHNVYLRFLKNPSIWE